MKRKKESLKRLRLDNFQTHKKLLIEFDSKVTVIVGKSDVGKTSIIRALRWITLNRPSTASFIRTGTASCRTCLEIGRFKIQRIKRKGINQYLVNGKVLKAFGKSVPEEITNAIRLTGVNFQFQHDPLFWITDSPGQVAKNLNAIIDLKAIDECQRIIGLKVRKSKTLHEAAVNRLKELKETKNNLSWVTKADAALANLEKLLTQINGWKAIESHLMALIESCTMSRERQRIAREAHKTAIHVATIGKALADLESAASKLAEKIRQAKYERERTNQRTIELAKSEAKFHRLAKGKPCPVCQKIMS